MNTANGTSYRFGAGRLMQFSTHPAQHNFAWTKYKHALQHAVALENSASQPKANSGPTERMRSQRPHMLTLPAKKGETTKAEAEDDGRSGRVTRDPFASQLFRLPGHSCDGPRKLRAAVVLGNASRELDEP
eukprot:3156571-Pleurochrysis_carterae.AAC.2